MTAASMLDTVHPTLPRLKEPSAQEHARNGVAGLPCAATEPCPFTFFVPPIFAPEPYAQCVPIGFWAAAMLLWRPTSCSRDMENNSVSSHNGIGIFRNDNNEARLLSLVMRWVCGPSPFHQWVMQDDFPLGRPAWTSPGITFVDDVGAHEEMKLRLLNGSHSALAYAGLLAGHETAANAFANEALRRFLTRLAVDELIVSLGTLPVSDPLAYLGRLHERFANPAIRTRFCRLPQTARKTAQRLLTRHEFSSGGRLP